MRTVTRPMIRDAVGQFKYKGRFWDRYRPFFDACAQLPDNAVVVIVGANDGVTADPARNIWRDGWRGWLVEPHPGVTPKGPGTLIRSAVAAEEGELTLYAMSPEAANRYRKIGAHGSCLTSSRREHLDHCMRKFMPATYGRMGDSAIEAISVPAAPLQTLLKRHNVPSPDLIQIDVEGMESVVVPQALALRPSILMFEHQHTPGYDLDDLARANGYEVTRLRNDTLAVLR